MGVVAHATPFHVAPLLHTASTLSDVQRAPALALIAAPAATHAVVLSVLSARRTASVEAPAAATLKMLSPAQAAGCTPTQRRSGSDHAEPCAHIATTYLPCDADGVDETVGEPVGLGVNEGDGDGGAHAVLGPLVIARTTLLTSSDTYMVPVTASMAIDFGVYMSADEAGPPSPVKPAVPVEEPAACTIVPLGKTLCTLLYDESTTKRLSHESIAMPVGYFRAAAVASPPYIALPVGEFIYVPMTREMIPVVMFTMRTTNAPDSTMYKLPALSRANALG